MNEASSRFVDNLVMEKLVSEKLLQVRHTPTSDSDDLYCNLFNGSIPVLANSFTICEKNPRSLVFSSPLVSDYAENNAVPVTIHATDKEESIGRIILVHGLFEENRDIYTFLIQNLNKLGYDIYQTTLPFHYERKPAVSLFGGEYFWSANVQRSRFAFKQSVLENYHLFTYLKSFDSKPVHFLSFSMGGGVTMMLRSLADDLDKVFLMNPTCSLSSIVWDSPLCKTIKIDLINFGWDLTKIVEVYSHFDPATQLQNMQLSNTAIGYGLYDMITSEKQYAELIAKVHFAHSIQYQSGHLNLLRVPKLAGDIHSFFNHH